MTGGILSDSAILDAIACGDIEIDPFEFAHLNPVSVDLTLGDTLLVYERCIADRGIDRAEFLIGRTLVGYNEALWLDAKKPPETLKFTIPGDGFVLRPGVGYLMHTRERIFTRKYVPVLDGKSSMGRLFLSVHETAGFGDPGFNGQYTLEVTVTHPLKIYAGMRIAQMRFHTIVGTVKKPYAGNYVGDAAMGPVASKAYRQFQQAAHAPHEPQASSPSLSETSPASRSRVCRCDAESGCPTLDHAMDCPAFGGHGGRA
jgi:dCTP deaminase